MFTIRKLEYRPWPVNVNLQELADNGEIIEKAHTFIGHFRPFSEMEYKALVDEVNMAGAAVAAAAAETSPAVAEPQPIKDLPVAEVLRRNAELFGRLLVGWGEVRDGDRNLVPYSTEALRALVTGPDGLAVSAGINVALMEIRFGRAGAKNSKTSAQPGQERGEGTAVTNSPTT